VKLRKKLEQDLKKLKERIVEICASFDNKLFILFNKRLEYQYRIFEHENYIIKLMQSIKSEHNYREAVVEDEERLKLFRDEIGQNEKYRAALENSMQDRAAELEKKATFVQKNKTAHYENYSKIFENERKSIQELVDDSFKKFLERNSDFYRRLNDLDLFNELETFNLKRQAVYDVEPYRLNIEEEERVKRRDHKDQEPAFKRFVNAVETESKRRKELVQNERLTQVFNRTVNLHSALLVKEKDAQNQMARHIYFTNIEQNDIYFQMRFLKRMVELKTEINIADLEDAVLIEGKIIHELNQRITENGEMKITNLKEKIKMNNTVEEIKFSVQEKELEIEDLVLESMGITRLKVTRQLQAALSEDKEMEVAFAEAARREEPGGADKDAEEDAREAHRGDRAEEEEPAQRDREHPPAERSAGPGEREAERDGEAAQEDLQHDAWQKGTGRQRRRPRRPGGRGRRTESQKERAESRRKPRLPEGHVDSLHAGESSTTASSSTKPSDSQKSSACSCRSSRNSKRAPSRRSLPALISSPNSPPSPVQQPRLAPVGPKSASRPGSAASN